MLTQTEREQWQYSHIYGNIYKAFTMLKDSGINDHMLHTIYDELAECHDQYNFIDWEIIGRLKARTLELAEGSPNKWLHGNIKAILNLIK